MGDRLLNGFIAGVIAGVIPVIINFIGRALELTTLVWADFMAVFVIGSRPETTVELPTPLSLVFFLA